MESGHAPGAVFPSLPGGGGFSREQALNLALNASAAVFSLYTGIFPADNAFGVSINPFSSINFVEDLVNAILDVFGLGGGGDSPSLPPRDFRRSHAIPAEFIGIAPGIAADNSRPDYPTGLVQVSQNTSAPSATPKAPQFHNPQPPTMSRPTPSPAPTPFANCIFDNLLTGGNSPATPLCFAGIIACGISRGAPRACVPAGAICTFVIGVGLYCYSQSKGEKPPELPPAPVPVPEGGE